MKEAHGQARSRHPEMARQLSLSLDRALLLHIVVRLCTTSAAAGSLTHRGGSSRARTNARFFFCSRPRSSGVPAPGEGGPRLWLVRTSGPVSHDEEKSGPALLPSQPLLLRRRCHP
ncbi:hypothetical protein MTO96_014983 [Rhipicephalus appendiculatus]